MKLTRDSAKGGISTQQNSASTYAESSGQGSVGKLVNGGSMVIHS